MASCAMDVAQLAHLLLSKSEVRGLHPINDKIWERTYLLVTVKKTRIKKKSNDAGNGLFDKGQGFSGFRTQIVGVESKARLDQSFFICVKIRLFSSFSGENHELHPSKQVTMLGKSISTPSIVVQVHSSSKLDRFAWNK